MKFYYGRLTIIIQESLRSSGAEEKRRWGEEK
jgi:hypothetical protein